MIDVAGIGPGNIKYLTNEVFDAIQKYDIVLAFKRVRESLVSIRSDIVEVNYQNLYKYFNINDKNILLLASGDPMFYGISDYLKKEHILGNVYTGISSVQVFASTIKESWSDTNLLSGHGRELDLYKIKDRAFILTDKVNTPNLISNNLYKLDKRGEIIVGYNLSYPDERIIKFKIGENIKEENPLCVVFVRICEY